MNRARGLGFRGWLPLVAVLCLVGPVAASPPMGRLEVTVLDDVTGAPLVCNPLVQVVGGGYNVQVNTDFNGLAVFDPIPVGNYTVTVRPADPYFWARQTVSVGAKPPPTQVTIRVERAEPTPYVEIMEPEGTVGNTVPVTYRFYQNDFHWLTRVRIEAAAAGHAGPTQEISDLTAGQLGDSTQVGTTTLADGLTPVEIRERTVEWDTTGLYNDAYTLRVLVWYEDPWDPGGDDIDGNDERNLAVRNLCFGDVTTSAGNPDYFLFDAKEGSGFEHPTITFEFKDEGQTSNAQGPYHYDWTAMVLTTQCEDPETACDAYVTGTATSPGTITVYLNDTAAQTAAGQQRIGELTAEHWGTLTFELCVEERETGDYYYYRMPYVMTIASHAINVGSYQGSGPSILADYRIADSENASFFQVDGISPDLSVMGSANPGTQAGHQYELEVVCPLTVMKAATYIGVLRGVDSHGDDGAPRYHREHENKRMLAVNGRQGPAIQSVTISTFGDNTPLDANPGNGQPGSAIGLRAFPDFLVEQDGGGADRRKVQVTVQVTEAPDQRVARSGLVVALKAFDVDDPSASEQPIDTEQAWPTENADNRDQTNPKGQFEGGGDQIERITDADGKVTVVFLTGMQPGDNYRIVAGMGTLAQMPPLKARANDVEEGTPRSRVWRQVGEEWTPLPEAGPSDWLESGALTVWRKLYVEVDSMGTPQYQGTSTALTPYVLTDTTRNWPDSDFNKFRPEDGKWKLKPNAAQQSAYAVVTSYPDHVSAYVHAPDDTLLTHASQGDPYLIFYDGFAPAQPEDDPAHDPADVPDPPWAAFGPALLPCYTKRG